MIYCVDVDCDTLFKPDGDELRCPDHRDGEPPRRQLLAATRRRVPRGRRRRGRGSTGCLGWGDMAAVPRRFTRP